MHPSFSVIIKKVVDELGLQGAQQYGSDDMNGEEFGEEFGEVVWKEQMGKQFPPKEISLYHGTSSKYMLHILSEGLSPTGNSNFDGISNVNHIFLTSSIGKARFHAERAAIVYNNKSYHVGGKSVSAYSA